VRQLWAEERNETEEETKCDEIVSGVELWGLVFILRVRGSHTLKRGMFISL
jgi:hypothetical protein